MILAVDVQYLNESAHVAGIAFDSWEDEEAQKEYTSFVKKVEPYEPGFFYKRELPCILALLEEFSLKPNVIIVDGHVYLDGKSRPGLGKRLYDALVDKPEIIGVAKKSYADLESGHEIFRGKSKKPLYITTTGNLELAKSSIKNMFGKNRIPVLLKQVDQLCREEANKSKHTDSVNAAGV
ncbi:endonuclease V [Marinobacter fuscus]|uniref:Endonuclease V n=1 Tax=Marinobacter fuscus TaxID=2109942 RepID=A0A2T1KBT5_9GAMM|nr:endonuclease V [Marinobacter fuscus]PSF07586.1 endonuclease V [Marinobacter fuscus]